MSSTSTSGEPTTAAATTTTSPPASDQIPPAVFKYRIYPLVGCVEFAFDEPIVFFSRMLYEIAISFVPNESKPFAYIRDFVCEETFEVLRMLCGELYKLHKLDTMSDSDRLKWRHSVLDSHKGNAEDLILNSPPLQKDHVDAFLRAIKFNLSDLLVKISDLATASYYLDCDLLAVFLAKLMAYAKRSYPAPEFLKLLRQPDSDGFTENERRKIEMRQSFIVFSPDKRTVPLDILNIFSSDTVVAQAAAAPLTELVEQEKTSATGPDRKRSKKI